MRDGGKDSGTLGKASAGKSRVIESSGCYPLRGIRYQILPHRPASLHSVPPSVSSIHVTLGSFPHLCEHFEEEGGVGQQPVPQTGEKASGRRNGPLGGLEGAEGGEGRRGGREGEERRTVGEGTTRAGGEWRRDEQRGVQERGDRRRGEERGTGTGRRRRVKDRVNRQVRGGGSR